MPLFLKVRKCFENKGGSSCSLKVASIRQLNGIVLDYVSSITFKFKINETVIPPLLPRSSSQNNLHIFLGIFPSQNLCNSVLIE